MIVGDDGKELHIGEIGEICIKGPQVMEGYWQRPAKTRPRSCCRAAGSERAISAAWTSAAFIFIEDRKKDMILVSGFNVYPNEVENVIVEMDGVFSRPRPLAFRTKSQARS